MRTNRESQKTLRKKKGASKKIPIIIHDYKRTNAKQGHQTNQKMGPGH